MKFLLRFADEADMLQALLAVGGVAETEDPERPVVVEPRAPFGIIIVRGILGTPGSYIPAGVDEASGQQLWEEVEAPTVWPGYHVDLYADVVPEALQQYIV